MGKIAFVFPGQGSQFVGMGKDLYDNFSEIRNLYEEANDAVGFSLSNLCFYGPEEQLRQTCNTQPALLATSIAILKSMQLMNVDVQADFAAGHSLGEYTAIVAAGGLTYQSAISLVHKRGQYMEQAAANGIGKMSAVLGIDRSILEKICNDISENNSFVQLANMNCPGQIIISGHKEAVDKAGEMAKELGAKRVIALDVSGPFHSKLMQPAKEDLRYAIDGANFIDINIPIISNANAQAVTNAEYIKQLLLEQLTSAVLWEDSINYLINQGVDTFIEIGPGKVLSGLIKKIDRNSITHNVYNLDSLTSLQKAISNDEYIRQI
jgi:[acyl-carrier-protein] S-malonyltransferase